MMKTAVVVVLFSTLLHRSSLRIVPGETSRNVSLTDNGLEKMARKNSTHCSPLIVMPTIGVMRLGEVRQVPGECSEVTCNVDGSMSYESCYATKLIQGTCRFVLEDQSKPYPECCARVEC